MIFKAHDRVRFLIPRGLDRETKDIAHHAIAEYSFILPLGTHSWASLRESILKHYDDPRSRHIAKALENLE